MVKLNRKEKNMTAYAKMVRASETNIDLAHLHSYFSKSVRDTKTTPINHTHSISFNNNIAKHLHKCYDYVAIKNQVI